MFQLILVPWDASPLAELALDTAVQLAEVYKAEIVTASVVDRGTPDAADNARQRLVAAFEQARDAADRARVPISHELIDGSRPPSDLLAYAHEHGFDLVVIGHHRHHQPGVLVLHGVTEHLVSDSDMPVLVVVEPAEKSE